MKNLIFVIPMFFLVGCAAIEKVNTLGGGKYTASYHDRSFLNSEGKAMDGAIALANRQCAQQSKTAIISDTSTTPKWIMTFPSARVTFTCETK